MKFKEGDKVRVSWFSKVEGGEYAGKVGIVVGVHRGVSYPYDIQFEEETQNVFRTIELEKEDNN